MKTFIIALLVLGIMMSGVVTYSIYIKNLEESFIKTTENLQKMLNESDWEKSYAEFEKLNKIWKNNEKILSLFNDHGDLDEIELEIANLNESIIHKDKQHSQKAVDNIKILLKRLAKNESLSIENILSQNIVFCHII